MSLRFLDISVLMRSAQVVFCNRGRTDVVAAAASLLADVLTPKCETHCRCAILHSTGKSVVISFVVIY